MAKRRELRQCLAELDKNYKQDRHKLTEDLSVFDSYEQLISDSTDKKSSFRQFNGNVDYGAIVFKNVIQSAKKEIKIASHDPDFYAVELPEIETALIGFLLTKGHITLVTDQNTVADNTDKLLHILTRYARSPYHRNQIHVSTAEQLPSLRDNMTSVITADNSMYAVGFKSGENHVQEFCFNDRAMCANINTQLADLQQFALPIVLYNETVDAFKQTKTLQDTSHKTSVFQKIKDGFNFIKQL